MYTDAFERLERIGEVRKISVPKGCRGKVLADLLRDYHFIIMGVVPIHYYDREFFEYNENVVMIARRGISYDNSDKKAPDE
jgi:phosphoglycerate dehydrogenase-like enzyme